MCKKTLKALTLSLAMVTLMLSPLTMNGQYNEHKFGIQPWGQSSMLGREGGSGNTYGISNQTYGSSADGFGITNQTYGQNESAPLGSGLLIMAVAGACYAGMKRNKKQTKGKTMRKYNFILMAFLMAFVLLLGTAQCKKEPATPNGDNNGGVRITLKVNDGPSTGSGTDDGEKLNVYPATGAVIFTQGDKIYVGNNGKYVGTLTFDNGLFQGTVSGDLSTNDYLHFYFVGNKPTSPSALAAGTTTYTVDISDQSAGLPAISYAPSTAKYSPSTTAYTAKLLNKSALVKFVPSTATSQLITVSGMKNNVTIDFEHNTLAPTGTTGGITLYSVSDTEKWAILLPQDAVPSAAVTGIGFTAENIAVPTITNNMYYNSGIGISMTAVYETYEADNSNWASVLASFNAEPTFNPMLKLTEDITINNNQFAITRANGTINLNGHTFHYDNTGTHALFLQNNVLGESLTIMNGTIEAPVDGNQGWADWYCGTVIFENVTFKNDVFFDGHLCELTNVDFAAGSKFQNYTGGSDNPGLVIINSGKFNCTYHQGGSGNTKGLTTIYGGKFSTNPSSIANVTIPEGYSIRSNTDSDSGTYPYVVKALTEPYEITSSSSDPSVDSFNDAASTPTPTLHFNTDYEFGLNITRANGIVDFNGHSAKELFVKNDSVGESITLQNGTISPNPIDGESGTGTYFKGTVIMENMTVNGKIFTDGHAYIINSGTYNQKICCDTYSGYPGTTTIYGGYFTELGFNSGPEGTYILYGGKYKNRPNDAWCAAGYTIKPNTDSDSGTYPWVVSVLPEGALRGEFTINGSGGKVFFSKGNLQYIGSASTPYWKFAEHQWDYLGNNGQGGTAANVDRDLFCFGASGYNHGAAVYQPWGHGGSDSYHYAYGAQGNNLNDGDGRADWGYNAIQNGGNRENIGWRTLSKDEWLYLLNTRSTTSGIRYAKAKVNDKDGIVVLPDTWDASIYAFSGSNTHSTTFNSNVISLDTWNNNFETNGAVFLPVSGWVDKNDNGPTPGYNATPGAYWSSTAVGSPAWYFDIYNTWIDFSNSHDRGHRRGVRLVRNVQ